MRIQHLYQCQKIRSPYAVLKSDASRDFLLWGMSLDLKKKKKVLKIMLTPVLDTPVQNLYIHQVKGLGLKTFILDNVSSLEAN